VETEESNPPSVEKGATPATPAAPIPLTAKPVHRRRRLLMVVGLAVAVLLLFFGIPWLIRAFNTVSTDDAYVNGYVTFVAPRVSGQVTRVLVEDNNRVKKGDVLVELDPKPYQVQVAIKQAALDTAQANLVLASDHKCLRICDLCKELGIFVYTRILQRSGSGKPRPTLVWCLCAR